MKNTKNIVKDFCKEHNLTEAQFYGKEQYMGWLDLRGLTQIPDGFNPTVGDSLYLDSLTQIPDGFNPTVGGLYLSSSCKKPQTKETTTDLVIWDKFIKADGIFTEIVHKRGNVYKVKKINSNKEFYLVTDGKFTHSHGDSLKIAKEDFEFKLVSEKLKNEPIKKDTIIDIKYYRAITGACKKGVEMWLKENSIQKQSYTAEELLPILEKTNAYGLNKFKSLIKF